MRQEDQRFESSLSCAGRPHLPYHVPVFIQWLSCAAVKIQKQEGLSREMCLLRTQKLLTTRHTHTALRSVLCRAGDWQGYSGFAGDWVKIGEGRMLSLPRAPSPELTARLHVVAKQHGVAEAPAGKAVLRACAAKNGKLAVSVGCLNNPRHSQAVKGGNGSRAARLCRRKMASR